MPRSRCSRSSSSRIWSWMVTSRAVVGSSAISSAGSQASAIAITTPLLESARELMRVLLQAPLGVGHVHRAQQIEDA